MPQRPAQTHPKRRRDAAATRSAILMAATRRFAAQGYEHAGVREIAADAGVTAALVNRYFGSKEGLFAEVIDHAMDVGSLMEGDRAALAERLARAVVHGRADIAPDRDIPLLLLLHSIDEPRAAKLLRTTLNQHMLPSLAECIGGPDADVRAAMVIAQMVGFAILDRRIRLRQLARGRRELIVALLSEILAVCIG
jgi:AcrR family transcriptional regulator